MSEKNILALPTGTLRYLPDQEPEVAAAALVVGQNAKGKPTKVEDVDIQVTTSKGVPVHLDHHGGVALPAEYQAGPGSNIERTFDAYWSLVQPGTSTGKSLQGRITLEHLDFLGTCEIEGDAHEVYEGVIEFSGEGVPGQSPT
jgi:hypothetical protein